MHVCAKSSNAYSNACIYKYIGEHRFRCTQTYAYINTHNLHKCTNVFTHLTTHKHTKQHGHICTNYHTCTHIFMNNNHKYIYFYTETNVYTNAHTCKYTYLHEHTCTYAHLHVHRNSICMYTCPHMNTHKQAYT